MEQKHIVILSFFLPPAEVGEGDFGFHLAMEMVRAGYKVTVVTRKTDESVSFPFKVVQLPTPWRYRNLAKMLTTIISLRPDLFLFSFFPFIRGTGFNTTLLAGLLRIFSPKTKVWIHYHQFMGYQGYENQVRRALHLLTKLFLPPRYFSFSHGTQISCSHFISVQSHKAWDELMLTKFPARRARIIAPPVCFLKSKLEPTEARRSLRSELGISDGEFVLCFFGHIFPEKRLDTSLKALSLIPQSEIPWRFLILGREAETGPVQQPILEQIKKLGLQSKVIELGGYDWDSDLASRVLHAADAAILLYQWGVDLSHSTFAAVASHKLPIITSRSAKTDKDFLHGVNAHFVNSQSAEEVASGVRALYQDASYRKKIGEGGYRLCEPIYRWSNFSDVAHDLMQSK